jgi:hypothetical protein
MAPPFARDCVPVSTVVQPFAWRIQQSRRKREQKTTKNRSSGSIERLSPVVVIGKPGVGKSYTMFSWISSQKSY